ncbi:MAG: cyanophycinase [Acidobacteriota bacterium]|nr:cyanophycinase [Acidobacteriota bacterium]
MREARPFYSLKIKHFALLSAMMILLFLQTNAQERLIIVGGGKRPAAAMAKFVEWAGKERAHILIIPWATSEPQASFDYLKKDLTAFNPKEIELAPVAPMTEEKKNKFLNQLKNATGVFFTGGDQVKTMAVLKDESLLQALKQRYSGGTVFGGTSAGAAIMSRQMITGEGDFTVIDGKKVQTSTGLGLLPDDVIVDQHFIKRQRQNRLFGLILQNREKLGIGIDEDTALVLTDNRYGEVVGTSQIMTVAAQKRNGTLIIHLLQPGQRLDLRKRAPGKKAR